MAKTAQSVEDAELSFPFPLRPGIELEPEYAILRAQPRIAPVRMPYGANAWLVTRHADVRKILVDQRFSRALACEPDAPRYTPVPFPNVTIVTMDPPAHTRIRNLVARAFTERRVAELRSGTEQVFSDLADNLENASRPADFVAHVSDLFPALVVSELLGVPQSDRSTFNHWIKQVIALSGITAATPEDATVALGKLAEYVWGLVTARRAQPTDDLIGGLVRAHDDDDRLSDDELVLLCLALLIGGIDATADMIANSVFVLLTHPDANRQLRDEPELLTTAVEELLRYVPIATAPALPYIATVDVEFGGVTIRKGDGVLASLTAANKDPDVFPNPDQLDITRNPNPHLAFSHGGHHCLGAQLARMMMRVVLTQLPQRFPDLALAVPPEEVGWKSGNLTRGPAHLPVTW